MALPSAALSSALRSAVLAAGLLAAAGPATAWPATPSVAVDPSAAGATMSADEVGAAISDPSPIRGDRVVVVGTGFTPEEKVTASLPSRNQGQLGSAVADAGGRVTISVTVPATLPDGDQEVLVTGTSGERASTGFRLRSMLADLLTTVIRWWPTR